MRSQSTDISSHIKFITRLTTNRNLHADLARDKRENISSKKISLSLSSSSKYPVSEHPMHVNARRSRR